jgi:magnesium transporter
MLGRRRVSVGAMNAMDHLADDLEVQEVQQAQRDQDHVFFDRGSTSPQMRQAFIDRQQQSRFGPTHPSQQQSPSMHHSAAAARFYRHRRNMSDSSIDSQGGAYIDHRRQPHSLSSGIVPRSVYASGGSGAGGGRGADRYVGRSATTGGTFRRDGGEDASEGGRPRSPGSPTHTRDDPSQSGISNATLQQQHPHLTTEDLDENAFLDDDEALSPRVRLERQASRRSYISDLSHHSREDHIGGTFSNELSRQGSPLGNPQEDVCFPAHGATGDSDLLDIGMSEMYGGIEHHELHHQSMIHEHHHAHGGHLGVPGVLQNYPFGFDFGALEEFAEREKEGIPIPGTRNRAKRMSDAVFSTSPPDYGTSASAATRGGHLDESGARRTMRQRKLSESVAPGRFQRKLAMFEGTGEEGAPPPRASGRARGGLGSILDVKTPLLTTKNSSNGYGSGKGSTPAPGGTARPYRFSFYSNSLPSTIHARSLAEIPAEGQTFEDLFVGHNSDYDESVSGTDPQMAFSPAAQTDTGAHTPSFSNRAPSSNGGGGGGGSTMPGMGGGGSRKSEKTARPSGMRTEMDAESNTWWLDVLCPTDQEMKVLSKVRLSFLPSLQDSLTLEDRSSVSIPSRQRIS